MKEEMLQLNNNKKKTGCEMLLKKHSGKNLQLLNIVKEMSRYNDISFHVKKLEKKSKLSPK